MAKRRKSKARNYILIRRLSDGRWQHTGLVNARPRPARTLPGALINSYIHQQTLAVGMSRKMIPALDAALKLPKLK